MKPPTFFGGIKPLKAETWLLEVEKLFDVFPCTKIQKVLLATYTLKDEARRWWLLIWNTDRNMTWARFNEIFYEKHFPQCFWDRKVSEFQELKQGRIFVAEYEAKFTELARFALYMVDTDYKKARKFEGGLDLDIFDRVGVLKLPTCVQVLDRSLMAEATLVAMKQSKAPAATTTDWRGKRSGYGFRKGRSYVNKKQNMGSTSSSSQSSGSIPVCPDCGRRHRGVCYRAFDACFRCGKTGHVVKDCPLGSENANRLMMSSARSASTVKTNTKANTGKEPLKQGRVFALVPSDVQNIKTVVSGILPICSQNSCVLLDSGSTHSFVSYALSRNLTRPLELMTYVLSVSTLSGGSTLCTYVYPACDIMVGDMILYVDLLPLNIDHFDGILDMD
ncbi:uncharacterized protein LOC114294592 [Camellia sinensis]|uniref:uncharacterized protein LOC114294592 n=1 Tax=Camellia sinensis TaxID=4442 RepID=UPI001035DB3B|nr:uncharacterized protein LOC114294592 [Camellia sinensis]